MSQTTTTEVQRALMRLAMHNATRSVPLLLLAIGVVGWMGITAQRAEATVITCALGLAAALWRLAIPNLTAPPEAATLGQISVARWHLEGNAAVSGLSWMASTVGIYPALQGTIATTYVAMVFGSIAVATFFMPLMGNTFVILAGLQIGAIIAVSVLVESVRSIPMALLGVVFGITFWRASVMFKESAALAIHRSIEVDKVNESLREAKAGAEAAALAKEQFLALMSHEIRTPMNGVLGALELLKRAPLNPAQRRLVRTASSSGATLMSILNDTLDHAKIEAGHLQLNVAPTSLAAVARSVVALFHASAETRGLRLEMQMDPDAPDWVVADAQRLKQVLMNLVGNAIKFTESGFVILRLRAPDSGPRGSVVFEVEDSGIGMPADAIDHLFQPFHQVADTRSARRRGTGLGLTISQRLVEAMGGVIRVRSLLGAGSTFTFSLSFDLCVEPAQSVSLDSGLAPLDDVSTLHGNVLVVEDNAVNRMIAVEMLRSLGVGVAEAEDGAQALAVLSQHPIDLVLMDCQMPVMDGYTATEKIRDREARSGSSRLPIVALTANASPEEQARAHIVGMDAHLTKPYTRGQLQETLAIWL
jgi:signal transduction histidine kinase/CheY-like chemotaxis protein